jgi:hypothetical protein
MRRLMTKEVTSTTVKVARIDVTSGKPVVVELEPVILLGNVDSEKAQKVVAKQHGNGVTVLGVESVTDVYEMEVSEFIKIARKREPGEEVSEDTEEI